VRPELPLNQPLARAVDFLACCAHPDGSFGGLYGSRSTRLYYPAGIEALAPHLPAAQALADHMRGAIDRHATVPLAAMDDLNLVPVFNAYCRAAVLRRHAGRAASVAPVPALASHPWRRHLPEAGLLFDKGPDHYTVLSVHKGGLLVHFASGQVRPLVEAGVVARGPRGRLYSTQAARPDNRCQLDGDRVTVTAELTLVRHELPTPWQFAILRLLSLTVLRWPPLRHAFKRALVRRVVTRRPGAGVRNRREIVLGPEPRLTDAWEGEAHPFRRIKIEAPFSVLHMATQGYWQRQDDAP
jgi:hypothetical protein